MAMGTRTPGQIALFVSQDQLPKAPTAPFFDKLNELLATMGFDTQVETLCRPFYAERLGRPSLAPGVYFRLLMLGYLLGIDSERGIALTVSDSLGLRAFLGYELQQQPAGPVARRSRGRGGGSVSRRTSRTARRT